jgi:hypothetical protein
MPAVMQGQILVPTFIPAAAWELNLLLLLYRQYHKDLHLIIHNSNNILLLVKVILLLWVVLPMSYILATVLVWASSNSNSKFIIPCYNHNRTSRLIIDPVGINQNNSQSPHIIPMLSYNHIQVLVLLLISKYHLLLNTSIIHHSSNTSSLMVQLVLLEVYRRLLLLEQ